MVFILDNFPHHFIKKSALSNNCCADLHKKHLQSEIHCHNSDLHFENMRMLKEQHEVMNLRLNLDNALSILIVFAQFRTLSAIKLTQILLSLS